MKKLLIPCVLLLAGCSGAHYVAEKPGTTEAQRAHDAEECWNEAQRYTANGTNPLIAHSQAKKLTLQCLQLKGYTLTEQH